MLEKVFNDDLGYSHASVPAAFGTQLAFSPKATVDESRDRQNSNRSSMEAHSKFS